MKKLGIPALVLALALAFGIMAPCEKASAASNTVYKLVLTSHTGSSDAMYAAIVKWANSLKEESGGRLNIEMHWGGTLAAPRDAVALVQQGGADITWSTASLNPSLFRYSDIMIAYGDLITNTYISTYAALEMFKNLEAVSGEYKRAGLKALAIHTQNPPIIGGKGAKVQAPADFKGLSVQALNKTAIDVLGSFGAAPIGVSIGDLYENLAKNVCRASLHDATLFSEARLYEQIDWLNTYNWYTSTAFVVMNQKKFDSLPPDLQQLINSKFEAFSMELAKDTCDRFIEFLEKVMPKTKVELYNFNPEMIAAIKAAVEKISIQPYRDYCAKQGQNADAIMAVAEKALKDGKAKYGPEYDWFRSMNK